MVRPSKNAYCPLSKQIALCWAYMFQSPEERLLRRALEKAREGVKVIAQRTEYLENITQLYTDPESRIFLENTRHIADNKRVMRKQRELIAEYELLCGIMVR